MSQQKQAPLPRQEFQEWLENAAVPVLVLQKGKHLGSVVKVPATPEIDYLFGCETFYGERISWSDRLEFCGLYDRQHQALHLLDDPLPNFVSGLTEEECQDSTAFGKRIAQEVDRYVEAAISNERSRLSVRELTSERNINSYRYYKGTEAGREAASLVFSGEKPDVQFHSEYYTSLTEDTLLSYLKSPEDYIKTTAEQYILTTYLDQPATAKQEQRTLAVQISDDMFQRLKSYLDAHAPLTQKALVQSLLNQALDQWEHGEEPLQSAVLQDNKKERTLAIAMPESLFHRVEQYVEAHNGVSKRVFVVGLVAQELQSWLMEQSPDEVQDQEFGPDQDEQGFGMSMTM